MKELVFLWIAILPFCMHTTKIFFFIYKDGQYNEMHMRSFNVFLSTMELKTHSMQGT
jgi:hypothetical protein